MIQKYLTTLDIQYYCQALGCSIGNLGYTVANDFFNGRKCANSNLRKLLIAEALYDIINNYIALPTPPLASTSNCITEQQMQLVIIPHICSVLNIRLPQAGSIVNTINPNTGLGSIIISEDGKGITGENGTYLIQEF